LVELIERRQRWIQVVGNQDSDEESENETESQEPDEIEWNFEDTVKAKSSAPRPAIPQSSTSPSSTEEAPAATSPPKHELKAIQNLQQERDRSHSDPQSPKESKERKSSVSKASKTNGVASDSNGASGAVTAASTPSGPSSTRPSALTSVIYPVLSKLLKSNQEEPVIAALAQLKIAFDNAERAKPGITHSLIAQIIETLKR